MSLWARINNAAGTLTGENTLYNLSQVSITRALDGAGRINFTAPDGDSYLVESLLQPERRVEIFLNEGSNKVSLSRGVIKDAPASLTANGWVRTAQCEDELNLLKNLSTLYGRKFSAQAISNGTNGVVDDLVALASGWSSSGTVSDTITARFDGENILKALQRIANSTGNHFRLGTTSKTIEFGAFGTSSGKRLIQGISSDANTATITGIQLSNSSKALFNRIYPLMNSMGEAIEGLAQSTRITPYTIQSTVGPDGQTLYYIEDTTSQADYGVIEKFGYLREVAPLTNSGTALQIAADSLYDWAAVQLQRFSQPQVTYRISGVNFDEPPKPGDTIHIHYVGPLYNNKNQVVDYRRINDDFWILEVGINISANGAVSYDLEVSNIDVHQQSMADVILGRIEALEIGNTRVQRYFNGMIFQREFEVDSTHDAQLDINLTDAVQAIVRIRLRIQTTPFRATAQAVAPDDTETAAGGTDIQLMQALIPSADTDTGFHYRTVNITDGTTLHKMRVLINNESDGIIFKAIDPEHTHTLPDFTLSYGIQDDTEYPDDLTITINGVDRTNDITGSATIDTSGVAVDLEYDVTEYFNANSNNPIIVGCGSGQGLAILEVEAYVIIQAIKVTGV